MIINHISAVVRTSLYQFVFDPTWLDPVAGATVDSATGSSQVGSNTRVLKSSSEPGRAKYSFFIYARLGLRSSSRLRVIGRRRLTKNHVLGFDSIDAAHRRAASRLLRNSRETPLGGGLPVLLVGRGRSLGAAAMDKQNFMAMNLSNQEVVKKPGEYAASSLSPSLLWSRVPAQQCQQRAAAALLGSVLAATSFFTVCPCAPQDRWPAVHRGQSEELQGQRLRPLPASDDRRL